jgi:hypothetical protein
VEILTLSPVHPEKRLNHPRGLGISDSRIYFNAIHDLEGLFWVFAHVGLTREGPGGSPRKEFKTAKAPYQLNNLHTILFVDPVSVIHSHEKKAHLLYENCTPSVPQNFAPYFEPLSELWRTWRQITNISLLYPAVETLHDFVIKALDNTFAKLKTLPPAEVKYQEMTATVDLQRKQEIHFLKNFGA